MPNSKIDKNLLSTYEQEVLASLYHSLDYAKCEDLPCEDIEKAILHIEGLNEQRNKEAQPEEKPQPTTNGIVRKMAQAMLEARSNGVSKRYERLEIAANVYLTEMGRVANLGILITAANMADDLWANRFDRNKRKAIAGAA